MTDAGNWGGHCCCSCGFDSAAFRLCSWLLLFAGGVVATPEHFSPPTDVEVAGPVPTADDLLQNSTAQSIKGWFTPLSLAHLADPEVTCGTLFITLDWIAEHLHRRYDRIRRTAHVWQDMLIKGAFNHLAHPYWFFRSSNFRGLSLPALEMFRLCQHSTDLAATLALLHGERCFFPKLRDALAMTVAAAGVSQSLHAVQLAAIYKSLFSFWEDSGDVLRHVEPIWKVVHSASQCADAWTDVRLRIDEVSFSEKGLMDAEKFGGISGWQDEGGAFSSMNFIQRKLQNGWHLDHGLVTSLVRLWQAPTLAQQEEEGCHMSIADFGAGSGHYCNFFNQTGEYCCFAFDGFSNARRLTDGRVSTLRLDEPFDLGKTFDWVMCLEVAEHVPSEKGPVLLGNLRRHARKGLVLSWSEEHSEAHPNAKPWLEVREAVKALGFHLDAAATASLRPQVPWLRRAVHIFRLA